MNPWFLLNSGPCPPSLNMALDEALLTSMPRLNQPVLRFYSWTEPAASFGYFQKYSEVERATLLRPVVRRPTGGGIVPHDVDWTYSVSFPTNDEWYSLKAIESYQRIHEWIRSAFLKLNVITELANDCRHAEPGQCFVGFEKFDVLWHGSKIAGAAQRRTRDGLLIQGSVQPASLSLKRNDWQNAMCDVGRSEIGADWKAFEPDDALMNRTEELARLKYSQASYNQKR
jgi:lipoate-protein ligase A